jgi:hypothetical protein
MILNIKVSYFFTCKIIYKRSIIYKLFLYVFITLSKYAVCVYYSGYYYIILFFINYTSFLYNKHCINKVLIKAEKSYSNHYWYSCFFVYTPCFLAAFPILCECVQNNLLFHLFKVISASNLAGNAVVL